MIETIISFNNVETIKIETHGDHAFLYLIDKNGEVKVVQVSNKRGEKLKAFLNE